jgi:mRNA interferase RelE/StbE
MTPSSRYTVEIAPAAERQIRKLEATARRRILNRIETLQRSPRRVGVEKLSDSEGLYRVRVGNFRIIYEIEDRITRVLVLKVGDRKEIYKR